MSEDLVDRVMSQESTVLKFNYGRIGISSRDDWSEFIQANQQMRDLLAEQMTKAQAEASWSVADMIENAHIGPQYRPGRSELAEVRRREANRAALRAMGHPAGGYRR